MVHSIRLIQQLGHLVHVLDRDPNALGFSVADGSKAIDICDPERVTEYARSINANAILAVNEAGVLAAAQASQILGLRYISPDVALRCLDKGKMREAWEKSGLPQPRYAIAHSIGEVSAAAALIGYPLIIKPALNCGSRGVSLVETPNDLPWATEFAIANSRTNHYIVEEAIIGTEMTIEGLVKDGVAHVLAKSDKEHQAHPRFRVAMALNYPARFNACQLKLADAVVQKAVTSLGIENAAFHCECIVNDQGIYLIELGARGGGGHIFGQIVEAVSGVCMPQALAGILLGENIDIAPKSARGACYKFFAPPKGVFQGATGVDEAKHMPGILDFGFTMAPGTVVGDIGGDADRPGYVVATGVSREEAIANADAAIGRIQYSVSRSMVVGDDCQSSASLRPTLGETMQCNQAGNSSLLLNVDTEHVVARYRARIAKHGVSLESMASGSAEKQALRHSVHLTAIRTKNSSVLDIGCGIGAFHKYLTQNKADCNYSGYDITPEYVEYCREAFPNSQFELRNIFEKGINGVYDTIVMSQVLNNNYQKSDNKQVMFAAIKLCFEHSRHSISIDMMSSYVDFRNPDLFYYCPEEVFEFSKSISRRVVIRHDYRPYEFCVQLFHEDAPGFIP